MLLQSLGHAKTEAEAIMGAAVARGWRLVNLPFREEYPGGRQWNLDAAQFKFKPAELADDEVPCHPHWDMIFEHIGHELTPALRELPWAIDANIRTGADYLRAWVACAFRDPFQPTPYLFFFGPENSGKSIFYESLQRLVTKGVVQGQAGARPARFNGELSGAIICAVEEVDISKSPGAHAKIKEWVTGRTISDPQDAARQFRAAQRDPLGPDGQQPGELPGLSRRHPHHGGLRQRSARKSRRIAKPKMEALLEQEAPHFLHTLMHMELPPIIDRLRLPVVTTASKRSAEEDNQTRLGAIHRRVLRADAGEAHAFSRILRPLSSSGLPAERETRLVEESRHPENCPSAITRIVGHANTKYVSHLTLKPAEGEQAMMLRVYRSTGFLSRSVLRAELVAEVETDQWPEDEAAFADEYGGDIIEIAPTMNPGEDQ